MKSRMFTLLAFMAFAALSAALITGCSRERGAKIVIKGSTTVLPIAQKTTEEYRVWHEKVMKKTDVRKDALTQASNGAIIDAVAGNPKAISYVGYGYVNASVKGLTVNGVAITIGNGKSGKFPLARKLYLYSNERKATPGTRAFIEYVLGPAGQMLVEEAGFIPLK